MPYRTPSPRAPETPGWSFLDRLQGRDRHGVLAIIGVLVSFALAGAAVSVLERFTPAEAPIPAKAKDEAYSPPSPTRTLEARTAAYRWLSERYQALDTEYLDETCTRRGRSEVYLCTVWVLPDGDRLSHTPVTLVCDLNAKPAPECFPWGPTP